MTEKRTAVKTLSCIAVLLFIVGCLSSNRRLDGREYIVSALGIDEAEGVITIYAEVIASGGATDEASAKAFVSEGSGKTAEEAFNLINRSSSEPLIFGHCGLVIVGENVSAKAFSEVCELLHNNGNITVSVPFITAKSPLKLLSSRKNGLVSAGYGIVNMLERESDYSGIKYKNRFYRVYSAKEKSLNRFALPRLVQSDDGLRIDGISVFENFSSVMKLDYTQSFAYALITDSQGHGRTVINSREINIRSAHTVLKPSKNSNRKRLCVNLKLSEADAETVAAVKSEVLRLFGEAEKTEADIFAFENTFSERLSDNFDIEVTVELK